MKERLLDVMKWGLILVIAGAVVGVLTHFSEIGILALWITALATAVIAYHAVANHLLVQKVQSKDEEFRQQVHDLYEAIVISNIFITQGTLDENAIRTRIQTFKKYYKGKTLIFN